MTISAEDAQRVVNEDMAEREAAFVEAVNEAIVAHGCAVLPTTNGKGEIGLRVFVELPGREIAKMYHLRAVLDRPEPDAE